MPHHRTFQGLHRELLETCSFHVTSHDVGGRRVVRSPNLEGSILNVVPFRPESNTRAVAHYVYTDGSRDDYYRSDSGIYIKSQDHILRIRKRNPDSCSVFRGELIAIDEALGSLASLPTGKEIWILSDSRSAIQHLSNWQSVRDNVGVSILIELK
ncbi:RNase H domain-containing protein [Trichonephila clavipes]|nr:RNase H domain-containing protein [Trichonephila clavipes]